MPQDNRPTLSLVVVFLPVAFMAGIVGRFLNSFGLTMAFAIRTDRQLIRAGASSARYVMVSGIAPDAPERSERLPVNVALILDRSGSMDGAKFALARQAVELSLRMLRAADRLLYEAKAERKAGKRTGARADEKAARIG